MGILRRLRQWRERTDGTLEGPAIDTDDLIDRQDGQAWETLREVGFEKGDVVTLLALGPSASRSSSTSNTSYDALVDLSSTFLTWAEIGPVDRVRVKMTGKFDGVDGGQTASARLYNFEDGEAVAGTEVSATGNGPFDTGWVEYTPATTTTPIELINQAKTSNSNESITLDRPNIYLGVEI